MRGSARLRRHGVQTLIARRNASAGDAGQAIRAYAAQSRADLIAAGAYGHPRVMKRMFGGTTGSLLASSPAPVFFLPLTA
ncbi:universal stress protein [Lysobacter enzymogenes]|uniref:Universal stress protein n=1 Tax=Lysobacter enzymogenes TaxID=69 RepID=A0A3N2RFP1_LYSEN|nr:universal stress protein [Lysobacter enzymogenes]